ncbi:MAG TPA: hypothetical protein PKD31_07700 [Blastocatellia bacterium]|nr:hypothetical protein [Blastocatellia bacterium]
MDWASSASAVTRQFQVWLSGSGSGAQTVDWASSASAVTRQFQVWLSGSGSGAQTVDWASSASAVTRQRTLTGNNTFTFSNGVQGRTYTLIVIQDGTGGRTVTWPASVKWPGASAPALTSGANKRDIFVFVFDGTNYLNIQQNYDVN